ncbi:MAG TPA: choice-of-anchor B family protein, partial [Saprospiraceae bacterium]|nr:choice-of-anchor B family protein [Saprospiraceae bacterium]
GTWRDFKTYRNYIYVVCDNCGTQGLYIMHMDSLHTGAMRQQIDHFRTSHNIYIDTSNARLYVVGALNMANTTRNGIYIYSLANPATPTLLTWYNPGRYSHDIFVRDHIAYSSEEYPGTFIYDVSNPNNIIQLGSTSVKTGYHHSNWVSDDGKYLYSAREVPFNLPLTVYEMKNYSPTDPYDFYPNYNGTQSLATPHNPFVYKNKLYVSYYQDGLVVFDLSQPHKPTTLAYYDTFHPNLSNIGNTDGAWGVYPYFPSGTIVVSDIQYGFYVLGLISEVIHDEDVIINNPGDGIILNHHHGRSKLSVTNDGSVTITASPNTTVLAKTIDADLKSNKNIVLRSPNGNYFSLKVNQTGIFTVPYNLENNKATLYNGNFEFEQSRGPILKDENTDLWYRLKIDIHQNLSWFQVY